MAEREVSLNKTRSLQRVRQATPHRLHWAFYMTGEPTPLLEKQDISPEDLHTFRDLTLRQNPALFFGSGITSSARPPKEVARFERSLRGAIEETTCPSSYGEPELMFDVGYSSMGRTKTPGSPIPEETLGEMDTPPSLLDTPTSLPPLQDTPTSLTPLQETFLTEDPHLH